MANGKTTKVKYPTEVKIGAKSYKVHWTAEEWVDRPAEERAESCWGVTNHIKLGIWINPELHPTNRRETLLHEILHCLFAGTGGDVATMVLEHMHGPKDAEEFMVSRLEAGLFAVLQDNPGLFAFIVVGADSDR